MDEETTPQEQVPNNPTSTTPTKQPTPLKRKALIAVISLVILFLGAVALMQYVKNTTLVNQHQEEIEQLREESKVELQTKLLNSSRTQLNLMMKSLVWAVRSALIRKNDDEIAQYFYELVQEPGVEEVILVDLNDNVQVSTNKKNELKQFKNIYPEANLNINKISFINKGNTFQLVAPILALDQKIGTLFIKIDRQLLEKGQGTPDPFEN